MIFFIEQINDMEGLSKTTYDLLGMSFDFCVFPMRAIKITKKERDGIRASTELLLTQNNIIFEKMDPTEGVGSDKSLDLYKIYSGYSVEDIISHVPIKQGNEISYPYIEVLVYKAFAEHQHLIVWNENLGFLKQ